MNKKQYICPYCFFPFKDEEIDIKISSNGKVQSKHCPNPAKTSPDEQPICNKRLPVDFLDHDAKTIAIYGGKYAGKSTFIASLVKLLLEDHDMRNYLKLSASYLQWDEHSKVLIEKYWNELVDERRFPPVNDKGEQILKQPIVLSILNTSNYKQIYLTFFDTAGEEFDDIDNIVQAHPYIYNANAILFFMDPLQIDSMQSLILQDDLDKKSLRFLKSEYVPTDLTRPEQIVKNLYSAIRIISELVPNTKEKSTNKTKEGIDEPFRVAKDILRRRFKEYTEEAEKMTHSSNQPPSFFTVEIPTAFCISKYDLLSGIGDVYMFENFLYTDEEQFLANNPKDWITHMIEEVKQGSKQIHDFLKTKEAMLFQEINLHFKNYKILGVAAAIAEDSDLDKVQIKDSRPVTKNLLHPLIWVLNELKFFK